MSQVNLKTRIKFLYGAIAHYGKKVVLPLLPELFDQLRVVSGGVVAQPQVVVRVDAPYVYLHNNHHFLLMHCSNQMTYQ